MTESTAGTGTHNGSEGGFDLGPPAHELSRLLDGVTDDRLSAPTPSDCDVATLLDHLMGLTVAFRDGARKVQGPSTSGAPQSCAADLDPEWRRRLPERLDELVEAWKEPGALEGTSQVGGVRMPAEEMAGVALNELVIHGWDLARGTGQPFECDPVALEALLPFLSESASEEGTPGLFGPKVDVPAHAPPLDRAVGLAGRDPSWTP